MDNPNLEQELDDLLDDIRKIIDDSVPPEPEVPQAEPEPIKKPSNAPAPTPAQPAFWTQQQKAPRHVARLQQDQAKAYADWLYEQGRQPQAQPSAESCVQNGPLPKNPPTQKKRKRHPFRNFVIVLLLLALLALTAAVLLLPNQPTASESLGSRRDGVSTILLAGTDLGGMRTDTLMLLTLDRPGRSLSLVSIPRDTLVNGSYTIPKINSVYGANNGGEEGIEMLLTRVSQCIGFRPDGYVLIELDAFVSLVDTLGGVEFNVPLDMYYNDPGQDLLIDLAAGAQTLNGQQAMGVVRFRSGYADADLGRVQVQRDFLSALIRQAVSITGVAKSPQLLQILLENTQTDLSTANFLWMAQTVLLANKTNLQTTTLPGNARMLYGGSYYVLDPALVVQTVNTYCNPYEAPITTDNLNIRQG